MFAEETWQIELGHLVLVGNNGAGWNEASAACFDCAALKRLISIEVEVRENSVIVVRRFAAMSGMGDGYVGTAQDAARIRRLEKQREAERKRIQDLKKKSAEGQGGLLQFGSGTSELLESAFKKETVGLVTREQFVEKRVNLQSKLEEEEKEKQQKLALEEEQRHVQKRKKRRVKGPSRLSFSDEIDGDTDEESEAVEKQKGEPLKQQKLGKFGKDPNVETSFLPDRYCDCTFFPQLTIIC